MQVFVIPSRIVMYLAFRNKVIIFNKDSRYIIRPKLQILKSLALNLTLVVTEHAALLLVVPNS
jgi:hypothetical protein